MDFFTMKRKKLQSLCKKHGIPANLKNIEMAERLSLIYKEKENENPVSRRLRTDKEKPNVEIIILDSDSDTDVQMEEAPDIVAVAEKDSNAMNNVNVEHVLDEVPPSDLKNSEGETDQFLVAAAEKDSNEMSNVYVEHVLDEVPSSGLKNSEGETDQFLVAVAEKDSDEMNNVNVEHVLDEVPSSGLKKSEGETNQFLVAVAEKDSDEMNNVNVEHVLDEVPSSGLKKSEGETNQFLVAVAEKDSDEMNNVNVEHVLDEVPSSGLKNSEGETNQFLVAFAEKDSDEMNNVNVEHVLDEVPSSGLKNSEGETASDLNICRMVDSDTVAEKTNVDQFLVTSPLSEVKSSDLNINHMVYSGTSGGNADVNEVKSASSQQISRGQEESQVKLRGEKSEDNVRSVNLEECKQMSFINEKIEENQEFYHATPADLNDHHMVDSGTASGHVDACEVISESLQTTSQGLEMSTMKLTPEKNDNVRPLYVEENMQVSVNVLEQFGNYMMMREDSDWTPVQFLPTSDLNIHKMAVKETCEEGMVKLSEKTCMVGDPEDIGFSPNELEISTTKGSEAETYFDQTTHGDVMETYNTKESMQVDNSDVVEKDCKEKTDLAAEPDQSVAISPVNEMKFSDLNIHHMVDSGTAGENADVCEVKSASSQQMKFPYERSDYNVGSFNLEENKQMSGNKAQIEDNQDLYAATPSDPDVHLMVDSDTVAEKGSNGKTNVDEVHSSGVKYLVGEPDQFLTTSPLTEVKSSDHNIHHTGDSGTATGNADACEVKSPTLQQMSHSQEETKMKLQSERSENNVGSFYLEEHMQRSANKEHIENNQELSPATPTDLDVLHMVDSGTAGGNSDACEMKSASVQGREEAKIKLTPERSDNVGAFYVEENMYISVNTEQIEDKLELNQAEPSEYVKGLEEFGNYMMMEGDSDGTPVLFLPNSDLNIHKMAVKDTCEEGMMKLSEKTCMVAEPEECIGFSLNELETSTTKGSEAETYFDQTTQGDVMETYNRKESMQVDKREKENIQEDCTTDQGTAAGNTDACEVKSALLQQMSQAQEEPKMKLQCERSGNNVGSFYLEENMQMSDNKEHIEDNQELSPATPTDLDVLHVVDSGIDAASGDEDAYKTKLNSPSKGMQIESGEKSITFSPKLHESSTMHKEMDIQMSFPLNRERDSIGTFEEEILKLSEKTSMIADHEDKNEPYTASTKRKRSDVVDTNIDEEVKAGELVHTVSQSSEMMSCNFSLQQIFASDTCEEEMLNLSEQEKTCMVADLEACIGFPPNDLEAATTKGSEDDKYLEAETCRIDKVVKENNQEDCFSAQGEVSTFFDNSDFGTDELVQTVPQPSEMESYTFSLQQLFASDTASGDENAYQKKFSPIASGEKNMIFSPKLHESNMTSSEDNLDLHQAAPSDDVNVLEEFGGYMMVEEDSDGRPIQFPPTSDHNNHKMAVRDTCEEEMLKLSEKICMVAYPEECIGFPSNDLEASTTKAYEAETYFDQSTRGDVTETYNVKESVQIDMMEIETNQEDCLSAQGDVSKFVDKFDVYDDLGGVGAEDENQPHMTSRKMKSSDEDDTSANSDEDLKADELVPTEPQPSEMESCNFSLQHLFAADTASGDEEVVCKTKLDSPSKATAIASGEKSIIFSPKLHESSMMDTEMGIEMSLPLRRTRDSIGTCDMKENIKIDLEASATKAYEAETYFDQTALGDVMETYNMQERMQIDQMENENYQEEDCISAQGEVSKFVDNSDVCDDIGGVGEVSRIWKSNDEDDISANSDEDLKADELVRTVPQSSEMESCNFGLQQLFSADTASGDEEAYKTKFDSSSKATPIASEEKNMIFSSKPHEPSMMHKEMEIEMSLPKKRERDISIGTCDMKENINIDKKEEVGSMMSKNKFAKRQPLQDLQQN